MEFDQRYVRWEESRDASTDPSARIRLTDLQTGIVVESDGAVRVRSPAYRSERQRMMDQLIALGGYATSPPTPPDGIS